MPAGFDAKVGQRSMSGEAYDALAQSAATAAGMLGRMYLRGEGVPRNFLVAHMWLKRASDIVSRSGLYRYACSSIRREIARRETCWESRIGMGSASKGGQRRRCTCFHRQRAQISRTHIFSWERCMPVSLHRTSFASIADTTQAIRTQRSRAKRFNPGPRRWRSVTISKHSTTWVGCTLRKRAPRAADRRRRAGRAVSLLRISRRLPSAGHGSIRSCEMQSVRGRAGRGQRH